MIRTLFILFITLFTSFAQADDFKFKLQLETVDHMSMDGAIVTALERGKTFITEKVKDSDVKLELESGRVYEIWIQKVGYVPHVIHNVHDEGDNKHKVTLIKSEAKYPGGIPPYHMANRVFEDVDKMTISAEMINDHVLLVKEEDLTSDEVKALERIQAVGDEQEKAQKKIDKLNEDLQKTDEDLAKVTEEIAKGQIAREDGEKQIEKTKKDQEKIKKELKDLAY
ncbi:MAG: hypothetical protein HQ500_05360 [Flavobacteriales bacterium]|nr:hypothetical protein [Flavobacteriales bacterium]